MNNSSIRILWPNGKYSEEAEGAEWLAAAKRAGVKIPVGCLGGSCGACEIETNGKVIRACISKIEKQKSGYIEVELFNDPYW